MNVLTAPKPDRWNVPAALCGVTGILALVVWMSHWVGIGNEPVTRQAFEIAVTSSFRPLLWLCAAAGFGWPMRAFIARGAANPVALQIALGVATMLTLDAALGTLGLLTHIGAAWAIIALGAGLLLAQLVRLNEIRMASLLPDWPAWSCFPATAVLLIATTSAPGWLWSSEFGGYDALSYHLQLPKEWLANGRIVPLNHNVYSFLPGYVEAAYLHLMSLQGGSPGRAMDVLYDCQMLHALLTVVAAIMTGTLASRWAGRTIGALAGALYMATPWTIVVGSLAYNEMAVNVVLAAGLIAATDGNLAPLRRGVLVGIFSAAAIGAKLTSIGFVAAPLGLLCLLRLPPRKWLVALLPAALVSCIGLLPYLLRNWQHGGNPVFPFATGVFGSAHWSVEQIQIFQRGHMPDASVMQGLLALWRQLLIYGFGSNPKPGEPWLMQWGILPWLGLVGGTVSLLRSATRAPSLALLAVVVVQIVFWLALTHMQSRFLIPVAVPLCVLAAIGVAALASRESTGARMGFGCASSAFFVFALSLICVRIFHDEKNGSPALAVGTVSQQSGESLDDAARQELGLQFPAIAVNWLLPPDSRVLLVGEAAPLYFHLDRIAYVTVWDRSPLSDILRKNANDPEAVREALRQAGFTHVLFNPTMLKIWERDHWNDPLVTYRGVQELLESACEPIFDFPPPSDVTIYALQD